MSKCRLQIHILAHPLLIEQHGLPTYLTTQSDVGDGSETAELKTHSNVKPVEATTMSRLILSRSVLRLIINGTVIIEEKCQNFRNILIVIEKIGLLLGLRSLQEL